MLTDRRIATVVGWLYITGTVAGVASVPLTADLLKFPAPLGQVAANEGRLRWGAVLMLVMGLALAMVPALLYPVLKRRSQPLALGYVVVRAALETTVTLGFAVSWLLLVTTAQQSAAAGGAAATQLQSTADLLVKGQAPMAAIGAVVFAVGALMLYYLLYEMRIVPRWLSGWGLVGAAIYLAAGLVGVLGGNLDALQYVLALQEMVMAVWLIVKGFEQRELSSGKEQHLVAG